MNVVPDMLDVEFDLKTDSESDDFKFTVELQAWYANHVLFKFNFSDSTLVSKGQIEDDKIYIRVKDSSFFVAKSGQTMSP